MAFSFAIFPASLYPRHTSSSYLGTEDNWVEKLGWKCFGGRDFPPEKKLWILCTPQQKREMLSTHWQTKVYFSKRRKIYFTTILSLIFSSSSRILTPFHILENICICTHIIYSENGAKKAGSCWAWKKGQRKCDISIVI